MAKALIGHLATDPRTAAHLAADNRRLRARVTELETLVLRLQAENDQLEARLHGLRTAAAVDPEMLPA
jgi:cell division protein FtsB